MELSQTDDRTEGQVVLGEWGKGMEISQTDNKTVGQVTSGEWAKGMGIPGRITKQQGR